VFRNSRLRRQVWNVAKNGVTTDKSAAKNDATTASTAARNDAMTAWIGATV
jgi:hypothetical protein